MSELERARVYYGGLQEEARLAATLSIRTRLGIDLRITAWTGKGERALQAQWPTDARKVDWDWPEKMRRHNSPKDFKLVFWTPEDRLIGLSLAILKDKFCVARFVEGDPRPCCPHQGKRVLFALEAISNYVQATGREEIRIHPLNEALASLYQDVYGFELVKPHKQEPYYSKRV